MTPKVDKKWTKIGHEFTGVNPKPSGHKSPKMSEIINTFAGAPLGFTIPGQRGFGLIGGLFAGTESARQRLWAGWGRRVGTLRKPRLMLA